MVVNVEPEAGVDPKVVGDELPVVESAGCVDLRANGVGPVEAYDEFKSFFEGK